MTQFDFRSDYSSGDLLSYVSEIWSNTIEKYGESRIVALDISKYFEVFGINSQSMD